MEKLARPPGAVREEMGAILAGLSRGGAAAIATGLVFCVAVGDYVTGVDVNFTLLYLGPIGFGTWFAGLPAGMVLSVASAALSVLMDHLARGDGLPAAVMVQVGTFAALVLLLGVLRDRLDREQHLARTDPLTQVANRRAFLEMAGVELERARRTGRPVTVAYLDVDDFKRVNDQQGHSRGDQLLATAAGTLRGATRAVDVVARLGGDEFGLLLVDTDGPTAQSLLDRLRGALVVAMEQNDWDVTFCMGAATFMSPPRSVDEMIGRADQLMFEAKRAGKNAVRLDVLPHPAGAAARA